MTKALTLLLLAALAAAAGRGLGFGNARQKAFQPPTFLEARVQRTVQLIYRAGRGGMVTLLVAAALASVWLDPASCPEESTTCRVCVPGDLTSTARLKFICVSIPSTCGTNATW